MPLRRESCFPLASLYFVFKLMVSSIQTEVLNFLVNKICQTLIIGLSELNRTKHIHDTKDTPVTEVFVSSLISF